MVGRNMNSIFDIKGKKKDILYSSPFPKKKPAIQDRSESWT